ncbi:MAG: hypothetical protein GY769_13100 [bacterium]|nr:hypothetical protein [bacterium]
MRKTGRSLWRVGTLAGVLLLLAGSAVEARRADPDIIVILRGTGTPVPTPSYVSPNNGGCFKTDLYDARANRVIGTGIDCLNIVDSSPAAEFSVDRTTIFNFPQGRLVARGLTTVVPIFGDSSPVYTHVVGDVDDQTSNIESGGTRRFRRATGNVRLSGIVGMGDYPNTVEFNCIFVIDLDDSDDSDN